MSEPTPKENAESKLLFTLHTKGIYIDGFEIRFNENQYADFEKWYNDLSDEQQWKVLDLYRALTRYERRHPKVKITPIL